MHIADAPHGRLLRDGKVWCSAQYTEDATSVTAVFSSWTTLSAPIGTTDCLVVLIFDRMSFIINILTRKSSVNLRKPSVTLREEPTFRTALNVLSTKFIETLQKSLDTI